MYLIYYELLVLSFDQHNANILWHTERQILITNHMHPCKSNTRLPAPDVLVRLALADFDEVCCIGQQQKKLSLNKLI